jgi:[ribosomal protein S5]-alanine N-acetyltransferase
VSPPRSILPAPELLSPRLRLRATVLDDAEALCAIFGSDEALKHGGRVPLADVEKVREKLAHDMEEARRGETVLWSATERGSEWALGYVGLHHWNQPARCAEVGYALAPAHWGRGYMRELLPLLVRFGFEQMGLHRIEAQLNPTNVASARVVERAGFKLEGVLRDKGVATGSGFYDLAVYALLETERG